MALDAKAVLVTGAASGIGAACVADLLAHGYRVAGLDVNGIPAGVGGGAGPERYFSLEADVADAGACAEAVDAVRRAFGRLDALIHMAAVHSTGTWREVGPEEFNRVLAVNVTGSFNIAKACAEAMMAAGGAIVLASSGSMNVGGVGGHGRGGPAYVSSKAAIIGLVRSLARSWGADGIRVNAVSPGATRTAMTADYDGDALRKVAERTQLGRIGEPHEIAAVARFLISDDAAYVTGQVLHANGGGHFA